MKKPLSVTHGLLTLFFIAIVSCLAIVAMGLLATPCHKHSVYILDVEDIRWSDGRMAFTPKKANIHEVCDGIGY